MLDPIIAIMLLGALGLVFWWLRKMEVRDGALVHALTRLRAEPETMAEVHLVDNDPITVEVRHRDGEWERLAGLHGVAAVRLYDELRLLAPQADAYVTRNGRRVASRGDMPSTWAQLT